MIVEEMVLIDLGAGLVQYGIAPQLAAFREAMAQPSVITRVIRDDAVSGVLHELTGRIVPQASPLFFV